MTDDDNNRNMSREIKEEKFLQNWENADQLLKTVEELWFKAITGDATVENILSRKLTELQFKIQDFSKLIVTEDVLYDDDMDVDLQDRALNRCSQSSTRIAALQELIEHIIYLQARSKRNM